LAAIFRKAILPGNRIRVLVVDDSVVIRRLVTHALEEDTALEVVGFASDGVIALARIPHLNPDVITLDIEMPEMNGLQLLRHIRKEYPQIRVVMFSTLTERGASATFEALALGADDYVAKAANAGSLDRSMAALRAELIPKIKQFFRMLATDAPSPGPPATKSPITPIPPLSGSRERKVLAVGVSTGGPNALGTIMPLFPADFPLPVVIVQHMPPLFTRLLAERLQTATSLRVEEAVDGRPLQPGGVLIAPGDYHMQLRKNGAEVRVALDQSPPENSCRPAVDVLFRSVGQVYGGAAISVILTGMGQDGLRGIEVLKAQGAFVIAQDESSSVVWGMPGAVVAAGLADRVVPLQAVVPEILKQIGRG
jgi:two-component system, chemotaxis family, protein-glutamate methylesterase/glutaminase